MGNTCNPTQLCFCQKFYKTDRNIIEIIVKDTKDITLKTLQLDSNKIRKIRFIVPIIKVTDEHNREHLVYHPNKEQLRLKEEDNASTKTKTIVISSESVPHNGNGNMGQFEEIDLSS